MDRIKWQKVLAWCLFGYDINSDIIVSFCAISARVWFLSDYCGMYVMLFSYIPRKIRPNYNETICEMASNVYKYFAEYLVCSEGTF